LHDLSKKQEARGKREDAREKTQERRSNAYCDSGDGSKRVQSEVLRQKGLNSVI